MNTRLWTSLLILIVVAVGVWAVFYLIGSGETVVVQQDQDGQTLELSEGDTLEVELGGNPTTGYTWLVVDVDTTVLTQVGEPEFDPETELLGSPGVVTLTFETVGVGSTPLELEYAPVSGGDADDTFEISLSVSD